MGMNYTTLKEALDTLLREQSVDTQADLEGAHKAMNEAYAEWKAGSPNATQIRAWIQETPSIPLPILCQNVWTDATAPEASVSAWAVATTADIPAIRFGLSDRHLVSKNPWCYWNGDEWKCWGWV